MRFPHINTHGRRLDARFHWVLLQRVMRDEIRGVTAAYGELRALYRIDNRCRHLPSSTRSPLSGWCLHRRSAVWLLPDVGSETVLVWAKACWGRDCWTATGSSFSNRTSDDNNVTNSVKSFTICSITPNVGGFLFSFQTCWTSKFSLQLNNKNFLSCNICYFSSCGPNLLSCSSRVVSIFS